MLTLFIFLAILGLLVLSHEFGHFIVARKSGMKVYEFGFGFPPRAIGIQILKPLKKDSINPINQSTNKQTRWRVIYGAKSYDEYPIPAGYEAGTIYSLNWLPLGGFVKIKGEEGENQDPDSFVSKSFTKKAITLFAGVAMNILLAAIIFSIGFMVGLPQSVDSLDDSIKIKDRQLQIMQVLEDMPADKADIKAGDIIAKIDAIDSPRLKQMQDYVDANKTKVIDIKIKRGSEVLDKKITPSVYKDSGKGGLGVSITEVGIVQYPWYRAIYEGFVTTFLYLKAILVAFYYIIVDLLSGKGAGGAVSGPIGIAVMTGQVAKLGLSYLLNFTAVLSLNLAILNILPIPALDGGRLLFLVIGKIFRKKVSTKFEQIVHTIGFFLLMFLVAVITVKDVGRFSGVFSSLLNKIF
jgi:regulator of sigma E protease